MKRACACGRVIEIGAVRCASCEAQRPQPAPVRNPTSWSQTRDRAKQARFRKQVLEAAGHQCQAEVNGVRCYMRGDTVLFAHHLVRDSWDASDGVALCRRHHRLVDKHAI